MKVLRNLILIVFVLLLLAVALLAMFPARVAVDWAGDRMGALQLDGVSGTLWRGHAQNASVHGQPIGTVGWQVRPWPLLLRRLEANLRVDGSRYQGGTSITHAGDVTVLRDATLTLPAERLQAAVDVPALNPRGRLEIDLPYAELVNGFPRKLEGSAVWRDAAVDGAAVARFGDLIAEFATGADGTLSGTVSDTGGPLMLDGSFRVAFTGFEADAVLQARDDNPQVLEALQYIGERQPDGSSILQIRGQLLPMRR